MYTINLTKEQFENLKSDKILIINLEEPKQDKWEPIEGEYRLTNELNVYTAIAKNYNTQQIGFQYETKEEAIKASKAIRAYARQLKWLSENSDGWDADWNNKNQNKYYIYYNNVSKEYVCLHNQTDKYLNTIYMSKYNAEKLTRLLNEGVVEF